MTERPQEQTLELRANCRRCGEPIVVRDVWNGFIVGRSYGFSHCGLVQIAKAAK